MTDHTIIIGKWTAERRSNGHYVIEHLGDSGGWTEYGPMPESFVEPLIAELRDIVQKACLRWTADTADQSKG